MAELNVDKMAKKVAEKALDDYVYQGKTIREWIAIIAKNTWIPVSERSPKDIKWYLTTTMYNEVYCDYWDGERFERTESVMAWMPLPEPYKEGESE